MRGNRQHFRLTLVLHGKLQHQCANAFIVVTGCLFKMIIHDGGRWGALALVMHVLPFISSLGTGHVSDSVASSRDGPIYRLLTMEVCRSALTLVTWRVYLLGFKAQQNLPPVRDTVRETVKNPFSAPFLQQLTLEVSKKRDNLFEKSMGNMVGIDSEKEPFIVGIVASFSSRFQLPCKRHSIDGQHCHSLSA